MGATEIKGEFGFEVVPGHHDPIMAAILHSAWAGNKLHAGKTFTPKSLFLEHRTFERHILYTGVVLEKVSLSFEPNGLVKASASFQAKERRPEAEESVTCWSSVGGATATEHVTQAPDTMAAASWDGVFTIDGERSDIMTALTLDITREIDMQTVLGHKEPTAANAGKFDVTGSMTIRPTDTDWWNKFHREDRIRLEVKIFGATDEGKGPSYTFLLPRLLLTSAPEDLSDPKDLLIDLPFSAEVGEVADNVKVPLSITRTETE